MERVIRRGSGLLESYAVVSIIAWIPQNLLLLACMISDIRVMLSTNKLRHRWTSHIAMHTWIAQSVKQQTHQLEAIHHDSSMAFNACSLTASA